MAGVTRLGLDSAGGTLISGSDNVYINSANAVRIGDVVASHGDNPHTSPVMATGSSITFVNGIPLCRTGDSATCGHLATGSSDVFSN